MRRRVTRKLAGLLAAIVLTTTFASDYNSIGVRASEVTDITTELDSAVDTEDVVTAEPVELTEEAPAEEIQEMPEEVEEVTESAEEQPAEETAEAAPEETAEEAAPEETAEAAPEETAEAVTEGTTEEAAPEEAAPEETAEEAAPAETATEETAPEAAPEDTAVEGASEITDPAAAEEAIAEAAAAAEEETKKDAEEVRVKKFQASATIDGILVSLFAEEDVLPDDAELRIEKVSTAMENQIQDKIEEDLEAEKKQDIEVAQTFSYDINIYSPSHDGFVQPDEGKVEITFKAVAQETKELAENENTSLAVYHVKDDVSKVEKIEESNTNAVEIEAEHFSIYTVTIYGSAYGPFYFEAKTVDMQGNSIGYESIRKVKLNTEDLVGFDKEITPSEVAPEISEYTFQEATYDGKKVKYFYRNIGFMFLYGELKVVVENGRSTKEYSVNDKTQITFKYKKTGFVDHTTAEHIDLGFTDINIKDVKNARVNINGTWYDMNDRPVEESDLERVEKRLDLTKKRLTVKTTDYIYFEFDYDGVHYSNSYITREESKALNVRAYEECVNAHTYNQDAFGFDYIFVFNEYFKADVIYHSNDDKNGSFTENLTWKNKNEQDYKVKSLTEVNFEKADNREFLGWSKNKDAKEADSKYAAGKNVKVKRGETLELYAIWKKNVKVPVAVYASDGTGSTEVNPQFKKLLGLNYVQQDGYYPVGVIYLPEKLFKGKESPYIKNDNDFNDVMAAIGEIDKTYLANGGLQNANNTVGSFLKNVQVDYKQTAGSHCTALFDWNSGEVANAITNPAGGNFKYHLDIRFATKKVTYKGVYDEKKPHEKIVALGDEKYLKDETLTKDYAEEFVTSANKEKDYELEGLYTDEKCTKAYVETKLEKDITIFAKFVSKKKPVVVTVTGSSHEYDGKTYTATLVASEGYKAELKKGRDVKSVLSSATNVKDNVASNVRVEDLIIKDSRDKDVTGKVTVKVEYDKTYCGKVVITKRKITLKSDDLTKEYDGNDLSVEERRTAGVYKDDADAVKIIEGSFVGRDGIEKYSFTGKLRGSKDRDTTQREGNKFTYKLNKETNADNYEIKTLFGNLTVTKVNQVTVNFYIDGLLAHSDTIKTGAKATEYKGYEDKKSPFYKNPKYYELDGWYTYGSLKKYDFSKKVNEDINLYACWKEKIINVTVTVTGGIYTYDGQDHTATLSASDGYKVELKECSWSKLATKKHVSYYGPYYESVASKVYADDLVIKDGKTVINAKVTVKYDKVYEGTITIVPRPVTLSSIDLEKQYDGIALSVYERVAARAIKEKDVVKVTSDLGFVRGEGVESYKYYGSYVGYNDKDTKLVKGNSFDYTLNRNTYACDYIITRCFGDLIVRAAQKLEVKFYIDGEKVDTKKVHKYSTVTPTTNYVDKTAMGYKFDGWYTDKDFFTPFTKYDFNRKVTENLKLYAKWIRINYTTTYYDEADKYGRYTVLGSSKTAGVTQYKFDKVYTIDNPADKLDKNGNVEKQFIGWRMKGDFFNLYSKATISKMKVTGDLEFIACYENVASYKNYYINYYFQKADGTYEYVHRQPSKDKFVDGKYSTTNVDYELRGPVYVNKYKSTKVSITRAELEETLVRNDIEYKLVDGSEKWWDATIRYNDVVPAVLNVYYKRAIFDGEIDVYAGDETAVYNAEKQTVSGTGTATGLDSERYDVNVETALFEKNVWGRVKLIDGITNVKDNKELNTLVKKVTITDKVTGDVYTVDASFAKDGETVKCSKFNNIRVHYGTFKILARPIIIRSKDYEKVFDFTALTVAWLKDNAKIENEEDVIEVKGIGAEGEETEDGFAGEDGVVYTFTGSQYRVNEPEDVNNNTFEYEAKEGTDLENYDITTEFGTLSVTKRGEDEKIKVYVKLSSDTAEEGAHKTVVYSGASQEFKMNVEVTVDKEFIKSAVKEKNSIIAGMANSFVGILGGLVVSAEDDERLSIPGYKEVVVDPVDVIDGITLHIDGIYTTGGVGTDVGRYPVMLHKDALNVTLMKDGEVFSSISDMFEMVFVSEANLVPLNDGVLGADVDPGEEIGSLTIEKRKVVLTSGSATKVYDGTPLTANALTISERTDTTGFAEGEGINYEVTGSITDPGTTKNTFSYTWYDGSVDGQKLTKAENYEVTVVEGDLTVTEAPKAEVPEENNDTTEKKEKKTKTEKKNESSNTSTVTHSETHEDASTPAAVLGEKREEPAAPAEEAGVLGARRGGTEDTTNAARILILLFAAGAAVSIVAVNRKKKEDTTN